MFELQNPKPDSPQLDSSSGSSSDSGSRIEDAVLSNSPDNQQLATPRATPSRIRVASSSPSSPPLTIYADGEARAFSIWITKIGPMLVNYGPASPDLWQTLIPQTAWKYKSVRELFLAIASTDELFRTMVPRSSLKYRSDIIARYNKAIRYLRSERTGELETFFASILGWALETYQGNYESGGIHINVAIKLAEEIIRKYEGKTLMGRDVQDMLAVCRPNLLRCRAYTCLALKDAKSLYSHEIGLPPQLVKVINTLSCKDYTWGSVAEAHDILVKLLRYPDSFKTHGGSMAYILRQWDIADIAFRARETEPPLLRLANHLLFSLAMSLLPDDKVCGWNEAAPGQTLDQIYTLARQYMALGRDLNVEQMKQLLRILQVLLQKSIQFYPKDDLVVQLKILLMTVGGSLRGLESGARTDVVVPTQTSVTD